jgi:hypothetical protein
MPGITAMLASTVEQSSLLLPLRWGAGPMAMLLWLNWEHDDDEHVAAGD